MAARALRTRMGAKRGRNLDISRLVEAADEIARGQHGAQHRCGIFRVGAQIAVAQVVGGKQWRTAGQIEHDIAARGHAASRRIEHETIARGGAGARIVVDCKLECAEMSLRRSDRALHDREHRRRRRHQVVELPQHHRDVEVIGKQAAGLDRGLVAPVDQDHALARQGDERIIWGRDRGGCKQGGHFRASPRAFARPAGRFADVDEGDRIGPFAGLVRELRRLLRAGDGQHAFCRGDFAEVIEFRTAEVAKALDLAIRASAPNRSHVEGHRVFARADQDSLRRLLQVDPSGIRTPTTDSRRLFASYRHYPSGRKGKRRTACRRPQ